MSLKQQTLWSIAPLVVVTAINVVSVPLFYRYLGPEMYALWFYVLTFTGAFGFMDLGLGVAVGRYIGVAIGRGDNEAVREYWATGNAIVLPLLATTAAVFIIIGVTFGPKWFNVAPTSIDLLRWSFVAGGVGIFLSFYSQFWLILSQAYLDFRFLSILRTGISVLQVVPSILLAWLTHNPLVLILWTAATGALQLMVFIWHAKRSYHLGLSLRHAGRERAREMASYTGKTFASLIINSLLASVDRLVLGRLAPPVEFTRYAISTNVGGRILGLSTAVMGPVFSNTNRAVGSGERTSLAAVYDEVFDFTFPWYALVSIWIWIWHPVLLRLWLGSGLGQGVAPLFGPIVMACCLTAITNISTAQLGSLNRVGTALLFSIATCLVIVPAIYLAWSWYGLIGVAWAFLLSRLIPLAQDLFVIHIVKAGGWLAARTWKHLALQVAIGLAFSSTALFWPRTSFWQLIPAAIHAVIVIGWLLWNPVRSRLQSWGSSAAPELT
jgi:O-antigen/teichoic acid export membrane protein